MKRVWFSFAVATALALSGCAVYPNHTHVSVVHVHHGPFTCHAYGAGGRHWIITEPNRHQARVQVLRTCSRHGGVGCYIPANGCRPY
jgi:hypothetical protein